MMMNLYLDFIDLCNQSSFGILVQGLDMSPWIIDLIMLGHLGKGNLSAGGLAIGYFMLFWSLQSGVLTALEMLSSSLSSSSSTSIESSNLFELRLLSYATLCLLLISSSLASLSMTATPWLFDYLLPENSHVSFKAAQYCFILIPVIWLISMSNVIAKYLVLSGHMNIVAVSHALGFSINLVGNYLFMYAFGFGYVGCTIVSIGARSAVLVVMIYFISKLEGAPRIIEECANTGRAFYFIIREQCICGFLLSAICRLLYIDESLLLRNQATPGSTFKSSKKSHHSRVKPFISEVEMAVIDSKEDENSDEDGNTLDVAPESASLLSSGSNGRKITSDVTNTIGRRGARDEWHDDTDDANENRPDFLLHPWSSLWPAIVRVALLGIPGGCMTSLNVWILYVASMCIATMGSVPFDAFTILTTVINFIYLTLSMGVATTVSIRISRLLSAGNEAAALQSARSAAIIGGFIATISAGLTYLFCSVLAKLFSSDEDVQFRTLQMAPWAAGFQCAYSLSGSLQGVLRGLGYHYLMAKLSLLALWVLGLPVGLYLAYSIRPTMGMTGLWIGLVIGAVLEVLFVICVLFAVDWAKETRLALARKRRSTQKVDAVEGKHNRSRPTKSAIKSSDIKLVVRDPLSGTSLAAGILPYTEKDFIDELERCEEAEGALLQGSSDDGRAI